METNLASMITDLMNHINGTDCMILNTGTLRTDAVVPAGALKFKDLHTLLPMIDSIVIVECTGSQIHSLLENGVSSYPNLDGKYCAVSQIKFTFDAALPPSSRIDPNSIFINGEKMVPEKKYRVTTKNFISKGKDGYLTFKDCPVIVDEHKGVIL